MRSRLFFFFIFLFSSFLNSFAQTPNWSWAINSIGSVDDAGLSVVADRDGNVYVTGYFYSQTITFGSYTLINADTTHNTADIFIVKYDGSGNTIWAKQFGRKGEDLSYCISIDRMSNIYISGMFTSLYISFGSQTLINSGYQDMFITKLDSSGNVLWAKNATGCAEDGAQSVCADLEGNVYLTGYFMSPTITFDSIILTWSNVGYLDFFIVKYDSLGNVIWANSNEGMSQNVAVDNFGNVIVAGTFINPFIAFDTTILVNSNGIGNSGDIFIAKFNNLGNKIWAKSVFGTSHENIYGASSIDNLGYVYISGNFLSPFIVLDTITLNNNGDDDFFVAKYDNNGNIVWAKSIGGDKADWVYNLCATTDSNLIVIGDFASKNIIFDNITLTNIDTLGNNADIFIAKYNSAGNVLWAISTGDYYSEFGMGITEDVLGNIFITGGFWGAYTSIGGTMLYNTGIHLPTNDVFIAKLGKNINFTGTHTLVNSFKLYPNPTKDELNIETNNNNQNGIELQKTKIEILNVIGQNILSLDINQDKTVVDLANFPSGVYLVRLFSNKATITKKIVKE